MSWRVSAPLALGLLTAALVLAALAATAHGAVAIPLRELPSLLWGAPTPENALWRNVLIDIRLPRVLFAMVTGAGLAISGAAMQALFRNPLAEPGLIGISAGGALGAVAAIVLFSGGFWVTAPMAFVGSLLATLCAYAVGRRVPGVAGLLLAGVAITAMAFSLIGVLTFIATDAQLRDLTLLEPRQPGRSPSGANCWCSWSSWVPACELHGWSALVATPSTPCCWGKAKPGTSAWKCEKIKRAGQDRAGQRAGGGPARSACHAASSCFVGLVVPHLVRITLGANHRWLLPATVIAGALALVLADWAARTVVVPAELPIGLVTGLVGGPFFLWLLARGRRIG